MRRLQTGVCLWFEFEGHLSESDARSAVSRWEEELERFRHSQPCHVWACDRMSGYDPEARQIWSEAMRAFRPSMGPIHVITNNALVRLGAWMLAHMSEMEIHIHRDEDALGAAVLA